jgi:hypothetical protein
MCLVCAEATVLAIATVPFWKKIWRRAKGLRESGVSAPRYVVPGLVVREVGHVQRLRR